MSKHGCLNNLYYKWEHHLSLLDGLAVQHVHRASEFYPYGHVNERSLHHIRELFTMFAKTTPRLGLRPPIGVKQFPPSTCPPDFKAHPVWVRNKTCGVHGTPWETSPFMTKPSVYSIWEDVFMLSSRWILPHILFARRGVTSRGTKVGADIKCSSQ